MRIRIRWRATSSLAASGQSSTPSLVTRWMRLWLPPMTLPETSLATIQSAFLDASLALGIGDHVVGFGGKADQQARSIGMLAKRRENVGVGRELELGRAVALLELRRCRPRPASPPPRQPGSPRRPAALLRPRRPFAARSRHRSELRRRALASETGPAISVTRAPAWAAAAAMAKPCLPDERLAITRTGSIGSWVGPAVIRTCLPASGPGSPASMAIAGPSSGLMRSRMSVGSGSRPGPNSPQAIGPSSGSSTVMPSAFS